MSVLHIAKGEYAGRKVLDGTNVDSITAFLFHRGGHADPVRLEANAGKSFQGSIVLGMGFTFDDTDKKGVASPLAEMNRLIEADPRNRKAIFPYIGGEEVNTSPTHAHHRCVINFRDYPLRRADLGATWLYADAEQRREWLRKGIVPLDYPEPVAADWPELLAIVEKLAKPDRDVQNRKALRDRWWQYAEKRPGLYSTISSLEWILATTRHSQHFALARVDANTVYAKSLIVFPFADYDAFCTMQSRPHEIWIRFFGSSMKDDLRYTPSDCFETFPFPDGWETQPTLETAGLAYYEFRAALMVRTDEGLTKTYNRFHDPYENDPEIERLRELHAAMDRAVLDAYGWSDLHTDCEFLLDYEIDEAIWGRKKKPYRYRWPDPIRDEVLARLLALNAERAAEEARAGTASHATPKKSPPEPEHLRIRPSPSSHPAMVAAESKLPWPTHDE